MPWSTPTLREVRSLVRDSIRGALPGADATIPNSVLRVLSDNQGALCHLVLQYIDWLSLQLLPDTAETEWLDRHGDIWLVNSDGTTGRKMATLAEGSANFAVAISSPTAIVLPQGSRLTGANAEYETLADVTLAADGSLTPGDIRALDPGAIGNLLPEATLSLSSPPAGVSPVAIVIVLTGGVDTESDDDLRTRVLERIRQPPMGGAEHDYVRWAKSIPGVTRAWCFANEMGIGTVTVRFMMDELRADNNGFPLPEDVIMVEDYLETVRPVAVKDFFVVAPIPFPVDIAINDLVTDNEATRGAIEAELRKLFVVKSAPGQTMYANWIITAITETSGVDHFDYPGGDVPMPNIGSLATLGTVTYG